MKKNKKMSRGITLIALVVTIIVLLLLAGISVNAITGDNSLIQNAVKAKELSEIENEKEQLGIAILHAMGKDKFGDLKKAGLITQLDKIRNQMPTEVTGEDILYVEYTDSHRIYEVDIDGNVTYIGDLETAKSIVRITANIESNPTPLLVQEVELKISTIVEYEDDEIQVYYGWTTDKTVAPESYKTVSEEGEKRRVRTMNVSTSEYGSENDYYLWVKVKILETGKETIKQFGPYAVKENITLIAAERGASAETYFLNGNLKRNQIKKITISNSLQGHTPTEDKKCWDVSTNNKGKILAWYEEIPDTEFYEVTIAQNGGVIANNDSSYLFSYIGYQDTSSDWTPTVIEGLNNLDTSGVTRTSWMFKSCINLISLDLTGFDTHSNTSMEGMFNQCQNITEIKWDSNKFVTDNVTNLSSVFTGCYKLKSIDVGNWNTSKNKTLYSTFQNCVSLTNLNVENWDTSNVDNSYNGMLGTFSGCSSLLELDLSNWNTSKNKRLQQTFNNCSSLKSLNISTWDVSNVFNLNTTFFGCSSLTELDIDDWNVKKVTDISYLFKGCSKLESLDLSKWQTPEVTVAADVFTGCSALISLDVRNFNMSKTTSLANMFSGCSSLTSLNLSNFNTENVTNMNSMFRFCSSLSTLNVTNFNTENVTNMGRMFDGCKGLTSLDISNFNTSKVTGIGFMFEDCEKITNLDLSAFNTSKLTSLSGIFNRCKALQYLDISNFDLSNVVTTNTYFNQTFQNVPTTVQITTNTATKTWLNQHFPSYTNIVLTTN